MIGVFLQGAVALGCAVIGLFFLRFWRDSQDRLFHRFALAFWLLASSYVLLALVALSDEHRVYVFVLRLLAFALIVFAIVEKNRPR